MLADFIKSISEMARESDKARVWSGDKILPDDKYFRQNPGQPVEVVDVPAARFFTASCDNLDSFLALLKQHMPNSDGIFYSPVGIIAVEELRLPTSNIGLKFQYSTQYTDLCKCESRSFNHNDFLRFLRINLAGCVDDKLVGSLREIKWKVNEEGESKQTQGRASIGKKLEGQLYGTAGFPEVVVLNLPVFDRVAVFKINIPCALEINSLSQSFQLVPLPGALVQARDDALELLRNAIVEGLGDVEIGVYYGTPNK